jgi:hypothetical protein
LLLASYFSLLAPGSVFPTLLSPVTCSTHSRQRGSWLVSKVTLFSGAGFVIVLGSSFQFSVFGFQGNSNVTFLLPSSSPRIATGGRRPSRTGCGSVRCAGRRRRAWGRCGSHGRATDLEDACNMHQIQSVARCCRRRIRFSVFSFRFSANANVAFLLLSTPLLLYCLAPAWGTLHGAKNCRATAHGRTAEVEDGGSWLVDDRSTF